MAHDVDSVSSNDWQFTTFSYPGHCFSPFVIIADDTKARISAATNWPPKRVSPQWTRNKIQLVYSDQNLGQNQNATYRALVVGNLSGGVNPPWTEAADEYKSWLKVKIDGAGLTPDYPPIIVDSHGMINVQLQDVLSDADIMEFVKFLWQYHGSSLNWMQFWGQMSTYASGCCTLDQALHSRYLTYGLNLPAFATQIKGDGGLVGFYSRPYFCNDGPSGYEVLFDNHTALSTICGSGPSERAFRWFADWMQTAKSTWNANAYYLDTFGALYWGDPLCIAKMLKGSTSSGDLCFHADDETWYSGTATYRFDEYSLIEKAVDIYPSPVMASAASHYPVGCDPNDTCDCVGWKARPLACTGTDFYTIDDVFGDTTDQIPFAELGTYILSDRTDEDVTSSVIINGYSNTGWMVCGPDSDFYGERQAFLLGHKFDTAHPYDIDHDWDCVKTPECMEELAATQNEAVYAAIEARDCADWWARRPIYLDRRGITNITGPIDVRRFFDPENNVSMFAVDNWAPGGGTREFTYDSTVYEVTGAAKLQIIEESEDACP